jgi:hypothetical protein
MLLLNRTAANRDFLSGLASVNQMTDIAQYALFGVFADGAGIYHNKVGVGLLLRKAVAHFVQHSANKLAVRFVLLTAIGINKRKCCYTVKLCR